jgi:hypothetical protein
MGGIITGEDEEALDVLCTHCPSSAPFEQLDVVKVTA